MVRKSPRLAPSPLEPALNAKLWFIGSAADLESPEPLHPMEMYEQAQRYLEDFTLSFPQSQTLFFGHNDSSPVFSMILDVFFD